METQTSEPSIRAQCDEVLMQSDAEISSDESTEASEAFVVDDSRQSAHGAEERYEVDMGFSTEEPNSNGSENMSDDEDHEILAVAVGGLIKVHGKAAVGEAREAENTGDLMHPPTSLDGAVAVCNLDDEDAMPPAAAEKIRMHRGAEWRNALHTR